ncbi:hypothetical protein AMTR_s00071p00043690 [Amborella trichopoda]|uniref:BTB domain-containing protein n=1 Tax=Amborella trichopoda TaxID=13333 RepID=U5D2L9_AMBTC|nr:hypothetical protein AMTR_s00071p00043690 [Amborella trichopoda]
MADSSPPLRKVRLTRRKNPKIRRPWCCSFAVPDSPDHRKLGLGFVDHPSKSSPELKNSNRNTKPEVSKPPSPSKLGLRSILSPGRVSPIELGSGLHDPELLRPPVQLQEYPEREVVRRPEKEIPVAGVAERPIFRRDGGRCDVRLRLRGRSGGFLAMEVDSRILSSCSPWFADKILESKRRGVRDGDGVVTVEVEDVSELESFQRTVELMYSEDVSRTLMDAGVSRAIRMLEVSSMIMFDEGVKSCLLYIEAVPWSEEEEEKLQNRQFAEDFVMIWANQSELLRLYEKASAMVRYEVNRVSAMLFISMGRGKLQCHGEVRYEVLKAWLGPMLMDFGWLQRCNKGLDMRLLEEAIGQTVLTLPMKQQRQLLLRWIEFFAKGGRECPDLSRAFQVWWRRSFSKGLDLRATA